MGDGPIFIDTPDGMEHFAICQIISRLRIETSTKLTFRQSTLAAMNRHFGTNHRTKKKALEWIERYYFEKYGWHYGEKRSDA